MAAQNIAMPGAIHGTLPHCLHKLPAFKGIAIIDEVSHTPLVRWAAILKRQLSGAKFICLGDFRSQVGPAFNRWRQTFIETNMEHAQCFIRLCDCNRVNFTNYRRGSNLASFKLSTHMVGKNAQKCMHSLLLQNQEKDDLPERNLTVNNHQRCQINKRINNDLHTGKGGVWVDANHHMDCQGFLAVAWPTHCRLFD